MYATELGYGVKIKRCSNYLD